MRQEHETTASFIQLKEITQIMQAQKRSAQTNAKAHTQEPTQKSTPKPKATTHAKNHALKPTKRAFSERQITAFRAKPSAKALKSGLATRQSNQKGGKE